MTDILRHIKVLGPGGSGFLDSAQSDLFQPSDWDRGHKFQGGSHGQVLTRDVTDATFGMAWSSVPTIEGWISSYGTPSSPVDGQVWIDVSGTSPTRTASLKFRDGGVTRVLATITF